MASFQKLRCLSCLIVVGICSSTLAQELAPAIPTLEQLPPVSMADRIREIDALPLETECVVEAPWWNTDVQEPLRNVAQTCPLSLDQLIWYAVNHSAQIQVYSDLPLIREQAIIEADAAFDWTSFFDSRWDDLSDPVGSTLTVGGAGTRYFNEHATLEMGFRRRNELGGNFEVKQQFGHQNTNSNFFRPNNQGTSRLTLSYTHPLLRGSGQAYNKSLIVLANLDACAARDEFHRQLHLHLLEVTRAYWGLRLERAALVQRFRLFEETVRILHDLEGRADVDANQSQIIRARAAAAQRRAELVRALAAVKNAEARIRGLVNAADLGDTECVELIPLDMPVHLGFPTCPADSMTTALHHRPEINQAMKEIKAACVRLNMAKHEMLPMLNLVAETYVSGLRGDSAIGRAWSDQFSVGSPSYSLGLQFEVPLGRRAATARMTRRQIEMRQLQNRLRSTTETICVEVEVALREVETSYQEVIAKHAQVGSALAEADYIRKRWELLPGTDGTAALVFDQLLDAQTRLTNAEYEFLLAEMTYNLSLMNLKQAEGTLMQSQQICEGRYCQCGTPKIQLDKQPGSDLMFSPAVDPTPEMIFESAGSSASGTAN